MSMIEKSIEVNVDVSTAYNQWTQFEEFPKFMEGIKEVRQLDDRNLHWRADIGGKEKEWDLELTEQIPDERIAWRSTSGAPIAVVVTFNKIAHDKTRIRMELLYEDFAVSTGDRDAAVSKRVENDLKCFKDFIESRGQETGAWRGTISQGASQTSSQTRH